jgi:proline dehydrogenase
MGVMRRVLLAASGSRWMRERATRTPAVRKAVARFMPGERLEDALAAAAALQRRGIEAVLTELGENVTDPAAASAVARRYAGALEQVRACGLGCEVSVKLTHLGLDLGEDVCYANLRLLAERAREQDAFVWIDMEQSSYVNATLAMYRRLVAEFPKVGVCLQAYLRRTAGDLASLLPLGGGIRLVKGAYREPPGVAFRSRRAVDANFLALAQQMLAASAAGSTVRVVFGTHDPRLTQALQARVTEARAREAEFHMLFGVRTVEQERLARARYRVRVLISYGKEWFPWYMRRLAERPANVLFAMKATLSS